MKKLVMCAICGIVCLIPTTEVRATQLVFTFINPSFGGSAFNGSWLLSQAQAQNKIKEKKPPIPIRDPIQEFEDSLNRQLLYQMSRRIIESAFGEDGLDTGQYTIGNYSIDVTSDLNTIKVVIVDIVTGNSTTVKVPYY